MQDSSVTPSSAHGASESQSQVLTNTTKAKNASWQDPDKLFDKLNARYANPKTRTNDPLRNTIKGLLSVSKEVKLLRENAEELGDIVQEFIDAFNSVEGNEDIYDEFERFQNKMNRWKPAHKLFTLTNDDFDFDRQHSLENNEAVLQRTVLTSILDRWRLNQMYTFTCESHWRNAKQNPLLVQTCKSSHVGGLKADLVIFYRSNLFTSAKDDLDPVIPDEFMKYAFPDGVSTRCFPFIFIEAKKGEKDLTYAIYSNMLNASQALWNIYQWMHKGGQDEVFF